MSPLEQRGPLFCDTLLFTSFTTARMTLIGQKRGGWRCYGESKVHRVYNGFTKTYRRLKHVTMRIVCRIEDLGNVRFYRNLTVDLRHCFLIDKLQGQHKITKKQGQPWGV